MPYRRGSKGDCKIMVDFRGVKVANDRKGIKLE